jgi:nitroimidazol reductase NimA-like FMN-containing flavoprotein (pyridoxamine 5'-phosphate oxidase superfamily)
MTGKSKVRPSGPKASRPHIPGYGLTNSAKGLLPWKWAEDRLNRSRQYWIATTGPGGRPHVMVIWALWLYGALYFSTGRKTRKAKNLRRNPRCTMCTDNAGEAVILEGVVDTEREVERIREFIRRYEKKYDWKLGEMAEDFMARKEPVFRLKPRVAFGLWEAKFTSSATRWKFN